MHDLDAEPTPDVRGDHVDVDQGEPELGGHRATHPGRGLRRGPDPQSVRLGVPAGEHPAALHRGGRRPFDGQVQLQGVRRTGDRGVDVAVVLHEVRRDVARHVLVHEVGGSAGRLDADDGVERPVADDDPLDRVFGEVPVGGHHHGDRLAHVVDPVLGQGVLGAPVGECGVRNEQRHRLGYAPRQVFVSVDGHQPVHLQRTGDVDVDDLRVCVRTAHEGHDEGVVAQIIKVGAVPAHQAVVLHPGNRLAEHLRRHEMIRSR